MKFAILALALVAFVATTVVATPIAVDDSVSTHLEKRWDCAHCSTSSNPDQCSEDCWCRSNPKACRGIGK
ncbi:hypothetical protein BC936DRAFT_139255 [Jimgerdemannia flammicorona]|uniref:Uncharacterized protein n=1 Tax=Jimgerdemannia flammicorona TaxID=994334 RepID=A0A433BAB2_9FUNG|nr:hypothetical protein BC936DRAFT_139255 [Jimgerdemannia flammicorona]